MIIELDEKDVFTFDKTVCSLYIHRHSKGVYKGTPYNVGRIKFANKEQAFHFFEMMEMLVDEDEYSDNRK